MVIDAFTFHNELELLDIRLNYLNPIVDRFVIVEATKTHSGLSKPLYFNDNVNYFKEFIPKIVCVIANNMPDVPANGDRWILENYQRNAILTGLESMELEDDDYIMISDVDEIPNISQVAKKHVGSYAMKGYMYYLNCPNGDMWNGTVGLTYKIFRERFGSNPQQVRNNRIYMEPIPNGGWHFGWLGGYERVHYKIKSFAHTEVDRPDYMERLEESINLCRPLWCPDGGPMQVVELDDSFPDYIVENQERFKHLIK